MPLPRKLLEHGVQDMLRISDARMSGTAFGTVVLHVAPEAEAGGPLAMVRDGDEILFDGPNRRLELLISPRGIGGARRGLEAEPAAAEVFARLLPAVRAARHAGRSGLRSGFPGRSERQRGRPGIALMTAERFVAGDWGTSRLRLFLCDGPGTILEPSTDLGLQPSRRPSTLCSNRSCARGRRSTARCTLLCAAWSVPASAGCRHHTSIAPPIPKRSSTAASHCAAGSVHIVPGARCENRLRAPDFMRGEETQILGALTLDPTLRRGRRLFCLPGTHTKWVLLEDGVMRNS